MHSCQGCHQGWLIWLAPFGIGPFRRVVVAQNSVAAECRLQSSFTYTRGFLTYTAFLTGPSTFRCADYLIIPIIALIMGSSNLWGYFKCSREAKDQLSSMTSNIMTSAATSYMSNAMRGGGSTTAAAGSARV